MLQKYPKSKFPVWLGGGLGLGGPGTRILGHSAPEVSKILVPGMVGWGLGLGRPGNQDFGHESSRSIQNPGSRRGWVGFVLTRPGSIRCTPITHLALNPQSDAPLSHIWPLTLNPMHPYHTSGPNPLISCTQGQIRFCNV